MAEESTITIGTKAENGDITLTSAEMNQLRAELETATKTKFETEHADKFKSIEELSKFKIDAEKEKADLLKQIEDLKKPATNTNQTSTSYNNNATPNGTEEKKMTDEEIQKKVDELVEAKVKATLGDFDIKTVNEFIKSQEQEEIRNGKSAVLGKYGVDEKFKSFLLDIEAKDITEYDSKVAALMKDNPKLSKAYEISGKKGSFDFTKGEKVSTAEDVINQVFGLQKK